MVDARLIAYFFVVGIAFCAGCSDGESLVPVEGVITLDGKPLTGINVVFDRPDLPTNENIGYGGKTDSQGRYVLQPFGKDRVGVAPGEYRVSLSTAYDSSAPPPPGARPTTVFIPAEPPPPPERVPPAYRGGKLTFMVPEGGTDQANFDLKSNK
jgi:hypothetical protein